MTSNFLKNFLIAATLLLLLNGCAQYRCYDGTYVENAYDCWNHGGLSYYSRSTKKKASRTLTGNWSITGKITSQSCPTLNNSVATSAKITEGKNGLLSIRSYSGLGSLSGRLQKNRAKFAIKKNFLFYSAQGNVEASFASNKNSAQLNGKGTAGFIGGKKCDVSISAKAVKR